MQQLSRPWTPALPAHAVQTFEIAAPLGTHWRPATCEEVECPEFLHGWRLRVEDLDPQDVHVATHCGRSFTVSAVAPAETWLVFGAGQPCFKSAGHRIRLEREERFIVRGGDWRDNPRGDRRETTATGWVDDFGEHQDRLNTAFERG
jgi:hypothetical protein